MKNILLIVDPQNDFITGSLAVEGAKKKMMYLSDYIDSIEYDYIFITMDTHPLNHCSFKENGGIWPKHCVAGTNGWCIPEYLSNALKDASSESYYHKGIESDQEEYSIFDNSVDGHFLEGRIIKLFKQDDLYIDVCGIAGDYCVLETIKGLRRIIGDMHIRVLIDYTASIDGGEKLINYLKENNISYE